MEVDTRQVENGGGKYGPECYSAARGQFRRKTEGEGEMGGGEERGRGGSSSRRKVRDAGTGRRRVGKCREEEEDRGM